MYNCISIRISSISIAISSYVIYLYNFRTSTETKREKSKSKTIEVSRFREIPISIKRQCIIEWNFRVTSQFFVLQFVCL